MNTNTKKSIWAVVALGQRLGIECPVNAALVAIIKAMERKAQK